MARRKDTVPMAQTPDTRACPKCGHTNSTAAAKTLEIGNPSFVRSWYAARRPDHYASTNTTQHVPAAGDWPFGTKVMAASSAPHN